MQTSVHRTEITPLLRFDDFFGKVIAELIAEGQSVPALLKRLNEKYILPRRPETIADIRAQREGKFPPDIDPELVVDQSLAACSSIW